MPVPSLAARDSRLAVDMLEVSLSELLVVAVVALVVLGPEELPEAARSVGTFLRSLKRLVLEVQQGVESLTQEETVRGLRKTLEAERRYIVDEAGNYQEVFDLSDMLVSPPEEKRDGNG